MTPAWLIDATPARRAELKATGFRLPEWYRRATTEQQAALRESLHAGFSAQSRLDKTMAALQDIDTFAEPLLINALKSQFGVEADVKTTFVCLRRPLEISDLEIEISTFEVMKLSLLQAALHNFEASECEAGAFHAQSGFVEETPASGMFQAVAVNMSVRQFLSLCRSLDIGQQYQTYLNAFFQSAQDPLETTLEQQFIASRKAALKSAADIAVLKKDIEPRDYQMILSVIAGEVHPRQGNKQVWFRDLSIMNRRMTGCMVFVVCEKYRYSDEFIVYIPHDPHHPLKRYTPSQMRETLKRHFTASDALPLDGYAPTAYQRFFSQFVAYADHPFYFSQFSRLPADVPTDPIRSAWLKVAQLIPSLSGITRIKELPPERQRRREPEDNPFLSPGAILRKGAAGIWAENIDPWTYLYEENRDKLIADARSHAVPTAEVDAKARAEKLSHWLEFGMLGLNLVSMFVPVLGEIMMAVMAGQLLYESFEGAIEWSEGDRTAAKAHLLDVAENLALIAVMAGVGKGVNKLTAVKPLPLVEGLEPVKRADGAIRLWKSDLSAYECNIPLDRLPVPDALGLHRLNDKTFIRLHGKVYQTAFDHSLKKWRIQHPTDSGAWQPILEHNGHGAWRHTLERPRTWDRLTLLRRIGPITDGFSDQQLLDIAQACGVEDNTLRQMHVDHLAPPPELAQALRLLETEPGTGEPLLEKLQRDNPGLTTAAARNVLLDANAEELARLNASRRIPLKMREEARWYAQQGRLAKAFNGLHMERPVSADSTWLALHALEKIPGWSGECRLEVRQGHINGPLIDGIGSEAATSRKYVVKDGPSYQAFDERGEALNSVPVSGDNFYASIMHALPDEARRALGVPQVSQSASLKQAVIDSAIKHREPLSRQLELRGGHRKAFKPPVRITERRLGYYASGRGQGLNPSLVTRVQDVYPALTDQQANGFILTQLRAGKTDAQIFSLLQGRMREWEVLEATLDEWVGEPAQDLVLRSLLSGKASVAKNLKQCWRNSPLAEENARFRLLDLVCDDPIPPLTADFSHVTDLHVRGRCITDSNADALLAKFPRLRKLRINATADDFSNVPRALNNMPQLLELSLFSAAPYPVDMPERLSRLTTLEVLTVGSSGYAPIALDISRLRSLRMLGVFAPSMFEWPAGVLQLPNLERLNLTGTGIRTLPEGIFRGHEKLWSGLSLDWSNMLRENFKPAYEYVKSHPEHLVDLEEMVRAYSNGELRRLGEGINDSFERLFAQFVEQWPNAEARFEAVEALSEEYGLLDRGLNEWAHRALQAPMDSKSLMGRTLAARSLRTSWRAGALKRYGVTADASILDLSNLELSEFPEVPAGAFSQVQTLYLKGNKAPSKLMRDFLARFADVERLDLSHNQLTEVPIAPGTLQKLNHLNLSANRILDASGVRDSFNGLQALEYLDLHDNPLNVLDVSAMTRLKALSLRGTDLHEWPAGIQDLPELTWLDLRDSQISSMPAQMPDEMLLKTDLAGAPLTAQAVAAIEAAWQRMEIAKGLPDGALQRFSQQEVPALFPPQESGLSVARQLLALSPVPLGEGAAVMTQRLQRLKPSLADDVASDLIEQMRTSGMTDVQISDRLTGWEHTHETLIRRLNGWLYIRGTRGAGWMLSSSTRRQGALRILDCWREGLPGNAGTAHTELNLNGLQLGDLPELPAAFEHVTSLNLTSVKLTDQGSDGFLSAFKQLKTLALNGNELQIIPEPVRHMDTLVRLELSSNRLGTSEQFYAAFSRLVRLQWLDLGYNELDGFDARMFEALETLDLRNNNLTEWPLGVLEANRLRTLNLSGNDIVSVAPQALDGNHDLLMLGTDLTDNANLSLESLERLRSYQNAGVHETVLGYSRADLDELIADAQDFSDSHSDSIESDEELPEDEPDSAQKAPWLANALPEEVNRKNEIWGQLAAEPDNAAFFHLLSRLQDTREFRVANADLTRRVWTVMEAAAENTELREVLFASSATHGTCVDGRILTFSGLESKVFTHNALLDLPVGSEASKGRALLNLSRQLFRLDKVDDLATKAATASGRDEAEVRLGYRIGLTDGWSDGLSLPGQPKHMTYASGVTLQQLADARQLIVSAEQSDGFFEDLIQRDYWVAYLKEKYPDVFRALDEVDDLDMDQDGIESAEDPRFLSQLFDHAAARNAKMIELSRKEVTESAR
jgi:Leucine-rich repeat (LRR) protein